MLVMNDTHDVIHDRLPHTFFICKAAIKQTLIANEIKGNKLEGAELFLN